jgi:hypothetical protein
MAAASAASSTATEITPPPGPPPAMSPPDAKPTAKPTGLMAKIHKQGKPHGHLPSAVPLVGKAGRYTVKHGSVTLGYTEQGERVVAHPGATIELTAAEAGPLESVGTLERLTED